MPVNLAVPDWQDRLRAGRSLMPALNINPALRKRVESAFGRLRLPDVPGKPTMDVACGDWFKEFVGVFLSAIDPHTMSRLVSEAFLLAPKKSSKTTYGAGMMLTAQILNQRPNAEFLFTGPTIDISDRAYSAAVGMIDADDEAQRAENGQEGYLKRVLHTRDHIKTIEHRNTGATLSIKTFDMDVATGVNPVGVLVDELHIIAKNRNAMRVLGQLRGGKISNPEAFFCVITTQSDEPPVGAMDAALKLARNTRDGKAQTDTLSILYEFPPEVVKPAPPGTPPRWYDPALWPMVTPNLGRSVTVAVLEREFRDAQEKGEGEIRRWASQHLNIEIGLNLRSDRWTAADRWEVCADSSLTLNEIRRRSEICCFGIDAGGTDDLLGFCVLGRERQLVGEQVTYRWLCGAHVFATPDVFERRKDIESTLRDFEADGDLTVVQVQSEAVAQIAAIILDFDSAGLIPHIEDRPPVGVDKLGQPGLLTDLGACGVPEAMCGAVQQGFHLNSAIIDTEVKIRDRKFVHGGSRMMAWTVGNARIERKGNAVIVTKQASGSCKIDALVAVFNAAKAMGNQPDAVSSYDQGISI